MRENYKVYAIACYIMVTDLLAPVRNFDPWARAVAETIVEMEAPNEATVHLIHIFDESERVSTAENLGVSDQMPLDELAARKSGVKRATNVVEAAGFETVVHGDESETPSQVILSTIETHDIDRVYVYSRKRSPVGKAVFGSSIQDLLFNAPVPVVVLPADATLSSSAVTKAELTDTDT